MLLRNNLNSGRLHYKRTLAVNIKRRQEHGNLLRSRVIFNIWKSSRMLGRSDTGDSIAAMAVDVFDSFLINLAVSNSLNTNHERIINPKDK